MKIESLQLRNFRCFENIQINFDKQLTVLVGVNGTGKTTILDALAIYLEFIAHNLQYDQHDSSYSFPTVLQTSISLPSKNRTVHFILKLYGKTETVKFMFTERRIDFSLAMPSNDLNALGAMQEINELRNRELTPILPILVFYAATRTVKNDAYSNEAIYDAETGIKSVFARSFDTYIDYKSSIEWFSKKDADEARNMRDGVENYKIPELDAVREAISKALPEHERPGIRNDEFIIFEKKTKTPFTLRQLSDGYRTMLALVMDLARRMAVANGEVFAKQGESVLESPAIVLIDEVELHLHPSWQQTVLPSLMRIFPNAQFIVTTHSPQVLTSIPAKHIRVLEEGKACAVPEETEGAESSRLLKRVLGVDPRPQADPLAQKLQEYADLVYDEKWDTPRALELQKELKDRYGNAEPLLKRLELHIENSKWERKA